MSLLEYFEALPEEKKKLQLGIKTDTPLANAFPYKRVVHPGLNGTLVPPKDSQDVWDELMKNIPKKRANSSGIYSYSFLSYEMYLLPFFYQSK